uniref:GTPase IMAP family member 8 n=1 Tax=Scleropages formosus TaxID=113540 RepID=A0A8C9RHQ0_SCLFO
MIKSSSKANRVTHEVKLVLLGRRGSGKSSCGNTILGAKVFQSFLSTTPVTRECEEHSTHIQGRKVTVIDTPDFFDDFLPDPDFHVKKCISMVGQESSVFLLVIQLGRFTEGEKKIVTQIQEVFGFSIMQNMIVLFSYGDDLEGVIIEDFLKQTQPELRDLVEKCGNRYHVFNNRDTSSDTQVMDLLGKTEEILLSIYSQVTTSTNYLQYLCVMNSQIFFSVHRPADMKLVLLGRRGSGKSSCGNTILGAKVFQSFLSTTPVTRECEEHSTHIQGRKVTVIDTPDFFGDFLPDPDFHVKKCISMVGQESSVFLLVIQLGRFTEGEKKIVTQIQEVFSVSVTQNMIVLFSYGDDLEGVTTEDFLKHAQPELRTLVEKCGNRYHVFNNRDTSSDTQVTELLQKVNYNRKHRVTQEVKLVLLGRRGSGKSSCGNTILGAKVFQSFLSTTPVTRECEEHSTHIQGRKVTVIDTPDFFGDFLPDPDFHVKKCISMVGQESSVFLLVIQLGRFTEGEKKIVTQIQEVFSVSVTQNMIVLFSYGDDLEGVTTEDFLKHAQPELRTLVEKCGNRYHVFNNRDTSSDTQVTELLQKVNCMLDRPKEVSLKEINQILGPHFLLGLLSSTLTHVT